MRAGKKASRRRLLLVVILALVVVSGWFYWALALPVGGGAHQWVQVKRGASLGRVSGQLGRKQLIHSRFGFYLAARFSRKWSKVKAGDYWLSPRMSPLEILDQMVSGKAAGTRVTIPEGFTTAQIADLLSSRGVANREAFLAEASQGASFPTDFPKPGWLEGYLFPDTYVFQRETGARPAVRRLLDNFQQKVWNSRRPSLLNFAQVIVLASLVEGEAKLDRERPLIAGVLSNRLRQGRPLQCDASIQYALGARKPRLTWQDLKVNSPYNTYLYPGLPPGPVNNPGLASIQAAEHPANTPYLYYVARPDGSHAFSRTVEEHQQAIRAIRGRGNSTP